MDQTVHAQFPLVLHHGDLLKKTATLSSKASNALLTDWRRMHLGQSEQQGALENTNSVAFVGLLL